jgi:hypothetical protein
MVASTLGSVQHQHPNLNQVYMLMPCGQPFQPIFATLWFNFGLAIIFFDFYDASFVLT